MLVWEGAGACEEVRNGDVYSTALPRLQQGQSCYRTVKIKTKSGPHGFLPVFPC